MYTGSRTTQADSKPAAATAAKLARTALDRNKMANRGARRAKFAGLSMFTNLNGR